MANVSDLPVRQLQVLAMAARGNSAKMTGQVLRISRRTVEKHRLQIRKALGVADLAAATALYDAQIAEVRDARECV